MPRNENTHMLENSLTTRQENRKKEAPFHVQKTKNTFFFLVSVPPAHIKLSNMAQKGKMIKYKLKELNKSLSKFSEMQKYRQTWMNLIGIRLALQLLKYLYRALRQCHPCLALSVPREAMTTYINENKFIIRIMVIACAS